jgi:diketogulonate reductase-like aldo/keto reductase
MPTAPLVRANGAAIPAIALGTWQLRGEAATEAVAHALKVGYRGVDTAAMYDNEEAVGAGIRASGMPRADVFVTTKVWYTDLAPGQLQRSAEASLKRLGLSEVDLLLIHWPNLDIPLEGSIAALGDAKRRGLARNVGVSNFPVALLERALALATEPLVANQCEYHPQLDQSKVLAACRKHGLAFISYCPIGKGVVLETPVVREIAARHGKTPAQVVLRWQVQQPGIAAIPKSGNPGRIAENLDVFDFALSDNEMRALFALARPDGRMVAPSWSPAWDR